MALPSVGNPCQRVSSWEKPSADKISSRIKACVEMDAAITPCVCCRLLSEGHKWPSDSSEHTTTAADWQGEGILHEFIQPNFQAEMHAKLAAPFPRAVPGYFASCGFHKHINIWSIDEAACTGSAGDHLEWLHPARSHWMWKYNRRHWSRVNQTESVLPWAPEVTE